MTFSLFLFWMHIIPKSMNNIATMFGNSCQINLRHLTRVFKHGLLIGWQPSSQSIKCHARKTSLFNMGYSTFFSNSDPRMILSYLHRLTYDSYDAKFVVTCGTGSCYNNNADTINGDNVKTKYVWFMENKDLQFMNTFCWTRSTHCSFDQFGL